MSKVPEKCPTCGADWDGGRYYKCGSWLQVSGHLRQAASCRVKELEDAFGAGNLIAGIFELCGIKETWTQPEIGKWVSDQVELRNNLRELVQLIKNRVVQNVHDNQKMESATEFIKMWIEFKKMKLVKETTSAICIRPASGSGTGPCWPASANRADRHFRACPASGIRRRR